MSARTQMCPHGRPSWRSCPHCLGINAAGEVSEPETVQATGANSGSLTPSSADDWTTLEEACEYFPSAEAARAALGRLRERNEQLADRLSELMVYTTELESRFGVWAATRPHMAKFPDGAKELGDRVRSLLASSSRRPGEPE